MESPISSGLTVFVIAVSLLKHSSRMFRYAAQAYVDRKLVFEADVLGVLV